MRKIICASIFFVFLGIVFFHPKTGSGGKADGEALFQNKCGQCHRSGGDVPVFAPVKYAAVQWERFFKRNKHKRKKDISGTVTSDEIKAIRQYLIDHAADSDRPIAAGLR